jgi:hypothetical protein
VKHQAGFILVLAATAAGLFAGPAKADIVVDNFEGQYGTPSSYIDNAAFWIADNPNIYLYQRTAARFEVPAGDFELTRITLPLRVSLDVTPYQELLRVRLTTDAANAPDSTLEVLSEADPWPGPYEVSLPGNLVSVSHPILHAGRSYWIVVEPMEPPPGLTGSMICYWGRNTCRYPSVMKGAGSGGFYLPPTYWPNPEFTERPGYIVWGNPLTQVVGFPEPSWPHDPTENVPVLSFAGPNVDPAAMADGAGGFFVAFVEGLTGYNDIRMQRVDKTGKPMWDCYGVQISAATGNQIFPVIIPNGQGGAIAAWQDQRSDGGDIYVQAVDGAGNYQWTWSGVPVCAASGIQTGVVAVPDGAGGAILAWSDGRNPTFDIYAQRVNAAGVPLWTPNGVPVCSAFNNQWLPDMVTDGSGGAILAWQDLRDIANDIYAQRIDGSGAPQWTADGVVVCNGPNDQITAHLAADGFGGAIAVWLDARADINSFDIYAQRIGSNALMSWPTNGIPVCVSLGSQANHRVVSDGSGGALIAWQDPRIGNLDIYTQRITASGLALWATNGISLGNGAGNQLNPSVASDGAGGALVAWQDDNAGGDIVVGEWNSLGPWDLGGTYPTRVVCSASGIQHDPVLVSDGAGGGIAIWVDQRDVDENLYAQRIERSGYLGNPEAAILAVADVPGDEGGQVHLSWRPSYLETTESGIVDQYRIWRSVPPVDAGALGPLVALGELTEDPDEAIRSGKRFYTTHSGEAYAWEYVATVPATGAASYFADVTSVLSGISGSTPETVFMIQSRSDTGKPSFLSAPASGHAVDDLPPAAPLGFIGVYSPGWIDLHWNMSPEPDVGEYRIYRGLSVDFQPDPGSLFAAGSDTAFAGSTNASYIYKLTAVDIHGNESTPVMVTAWQSSVPAPGEARFRLRAPIPNPARGAATITWTQPERGPVSLSMFDVRGARVAVLRDAVEEAGEHETPILLQDSQGRPLANGLYFLRFRWNGGSETRRIAVIR